MADNESSSAKLLVGFKATLIPVFAVGIDSAYGLLFKGPLKEYSSLQGFFSSITLAITILLLELILNKITERAKRKWVHSEREKVLAEIKDLEKMQKDYDLDDSTLKDFEEKKSELHKRWLRLGESL